MDNGKISIAVVTDRFFTSNHASVIRIRSIVNAINNTNKFEIKIYSTKQGYKKEIYPSSITFSPPPSNKNSLVLRLLTEIMLGIELFIRLAFNKHDLIFTTSPPYLMTLFCIAIAKIKRVPYIVDIRDLYPDVYFSAGILSEENIFGVFLRNLEIKLYSKAFIVTTVTKSYVDHIKNSTKIENNVLLLRNGYSKNVIQEVEHKYNTFTLIYHGNLGKFQDVELLLRLAERLSRFDSDIEILIIGSGSKDHLIRSSYLENIKYYGQLEMEDVYSLIPKAHLGLSFRTDDKVSRGAFPVKIYEYIAFGIPIIVTPISEAGKFVEKNIIGCQYSHEQIDDIVSTIIDLKENINNLQRLSENTHAIKYKFSREKIAEDFVKILEQRLKL